MSRRYPAGKEEHPLSGDRAAVLTWSTCQSKITVEIALASPLFEKPIKLFGRFGDRDTNSRKRLFAEADRAIAELATAEVMQR